MLSSKQTVERKLLNKYNVQASILKDAACKDFKFKLKTLSNDEQNIFKLFILEFSIFYSK